MARPPLLRVRFIPVFAAVLAIAGCSPGGGADSRAPTVDPTGAPTERAAAVAVDVDVVRELRDLERRSGARLGLHAVDTATGAVVAHRADERFAVASTLKVFAVAALLADADAGDLDARVRVDPEDLVTYSPVTEAAVGSTIDLRTVAEAAVRVSDNTAMNLVLEEIGGPAGLEEALRSVGDTVTRPTRREPALNDVAPGETSDTSTPRAMTDTLRAFLVDDALDVADRRLLLGWMRRSTTGLDLVRAGVPDGWSVADKSGTPSGYGGLNDIAVVRPPGAPARAPWVITVFTDRSRGGEDAAPADDLVAEATAVVVEALGGVQR